MTDNQDTQRDRLAELQSEMRHLSRNRNRSISKIARTISNDLRTVKEARSEGRIFEAAVNGVCERLQTIIEKHNLLEANKRDRGYVVAGILEECRNTLYNSPAIKQVIARPGHHL